MILANNHPSGISEPSHAGKVMRVQIKKRIGNSRHAYIGSLYFGGESTVSLR
ncbi:hypothetical protein LNO36_19480 [Klebsiella variicola subsp. variicola]|nr:hypothetical protein [Klebsiella variicola subsp. variicola]